MTENWQNISVLKNDRKFQYWKLTERFSTENNFLLSVHKMYVIDCVLKRHWYNMQWYCTLFKSTVHIVALKVHEYVRLISGSVCKTHQNNQFSVNNTSIITSNSISNHNTMRTQTNRRHIYFHTCALSFINAMQCWTQTIQEVDIFHYCRGRSETCSSFWIHRKNYEIYFKYYFPGYYNNNQRDFTDRSFQC